MALKFIRPDKAEESKTPQKPEKLTATLNMDGMLTLGANAYNILKLYNPKSVSFAYNDDGELVMVVMDGKSNGDFPINDFFNKHCISTNGVLKHLFEDSAKNTIDFVLILDETITDMNAYKMIRNF